VEAFGLVLGFILLATIWTISGIIGYAIGVSRNSARDGALLGLLFGPLGWLLELLNDDRPICPACCKRVAIDATKCRFCHSSLIQPTSTPPSIPNGRPVLRSAPSREILR